jgi:uncharacterized membrane protein (DUF485 family)
MQDNLGKPMEDKNKHQRFIVLLTLLPFPLFFLFGVLIGAAFWAIPNAGNAPGWILNVLEVIYCVPYLNSILVAILGIILSLTVWRSSRTLWINILIGIDIGLVGLNVLVVGIIYYVLTYTQPFTF